MRVFHSDDGTLTIDDVIHGQPEATEIIFGLMQEFFPYGWKFAPWLRRRAAGGAAVDSRFYPHQWLLRVNGEVAGFYIFDYVPGRASGLSMFMGIYPQYRRLRFGGHSRLAGLLFALSVQQVADDARALGQPAPYGLAAEIETIELVERYRQYNFYELPVTYYEPIFPDPLVAWHPSLDLTALQYKRVTLGVFVDQFRPSEIANPQRLENWVASYLVDFYGLPEESWPMTQALASIRT